MTKYLVLSQYVPDPVVLMVMTKLDFKLKTIKNAEPVGFVFQELEQCWLPGFFSETNDNDDIETMFVVVRRNNNDSRKI